MKNNDQKVQSKGNRSFPQEMRQAFVEWVKELPFIKRDDPKDPGREHLEETPADQASAPHPTDDAVAGRPPDTKERQWPVSGNPGRVPTSSHGR
jgi:hypothetical protein